jgi:photosystem II stability/assembly factor-like uncharacterized protein
MKNKIGRVASTFLMVALFGLVSACSDGGEVVTDAGSPPTTDGQPDGQTDSAAVDSLVGNDGPAPATLSWKDVGFNQAVGGDIYHITEILLTQGGQTIYVFYYDSTNAGFVARSTDAGGAWKKVALSLKQVKASLALPGGIILAGGSPVGNASPLQFSADGGDTWEACGKEAGGTKFPNKNSSGVWDLLLAADGSVYVATDNANNDPTKDNPTVYRSTDKCKALQALAPILGSGILALAEDSSGNIYAANQESTEHDDPELAGQAHVFRSADKGQSWTETGILEGANRVYKMVVKQDGKTLLAGSGIRGEFYRSNNEGASWTKTTHVPTGTKLRGSPPTPTVVDATRVYSILELKDGRVLVGTGNKTGDLFLTSDDGTTWESTGETGKSIVSWASAQADDGTIWIGTGSFGGDLYRATP